VEEEEEEEMVAFGVEDAVEEEEEEDLPAVGKCKYHDKRNNKITRGVCTPPVHPDSGAGLLLPNF
jgi:hypothetical protein